MSESVSEQQIEELRRRWRTDRSSRVFLQLAEAHRRRGEAAEAVAVLEEGLEAHPTSLAGEVALGRSLLDLGEVERAEERLEGVLRRDPTQLVAYRALVDVHLRRGDGERAFERLSLYRQLNPLDPDLPALESAVDAIARSSADVSSEPDPLDPPVADEAGGELEDTQVLERWPAEPAPEEPEEAAAGFGSPGPEDEVVTADDAAAGSDATGDGEGEGEDDVDPGSEADPRVEVETEDAPWFEASHESSGSWLGDWEEVEESASTAERWPDAPDDAPVHGEILPLEPRRDEAAPLDLASLATRRLSAPYWRSDAAARDRAPGSRRASTATLGRLYQEQGYEHEAREVFARIASDGGETRATDTARPSAASRLSARRLLAESEPGLGAAERRLLVVERYGRLLREARSRVS